MGSKSILDIVNHWRNRYFDFISSYASISLIMIMNIVSGVIVARILAPEGRGELALAVQLSGTAATLAALGIPTGVVLAVAPTVRRHRIIPFSYRLIALVLAASVIFAGGIFLFAGNRAYTVSTDSVVAWAALIFLATLAGVVGAVSIALLKAHGLTGSVNLAVLVNPLVYFALICALSLTQLPSLSYFVANIIGSLAALAVAIIQLHRSLDLAGDSRESVERVKSSVTRFSLLSYAGTVLTSDVLMLDVLFLGRYATTGVVALYVTALSVASLVRFQAVAASNVLFPRMAMTRSANLSTIVRVGLLALCTAILLLPVGIFGIPILYGPDYSISSSILLLVLLASALVVPRTLLVDGSRSLGLIWSTTSIQVFGTLFLAVSLLLAHTSDLLTVAAIVLVANLGTTAAFGLLVLSAKRRPSKATPLPLSASDPLVYVGD